MIWVLLLLLTFLAFFLLGPVWRKERAKLEAYTEENLTLYKERLKELEESDYDSEYKQSMRLELDREFLASEGNAVLAAQASSIDVKRRLIVPVALLLFVALGSLSLYQYWGADDEIAATELLYASNKEGFTPEQQEQLFKMMAKVTANNPKKLEWGFYYGRLNMQIGEYNKAAIVFSDLLKALPTENDVDRIAILNELAEARFFAANQRPSKEIYQLLQRSLSLEPKQSPIQAQAGMMAFSLGDYKSAIKHWRSLWEMLPNDPNAEIFEQGIQRAAQRLEEQGETVDLSFLQRTQIRVLVDISQEARSQVPMNTLVFVSAVAASGPAMPLAAQRLTVADLPIEVSLSDAQAMMPGMNISSFPLLTLRATASLSGEPGVKPGDWTGFITPISNKEEKVMKITIETQAK